MKDVKYIVADVGSDAAAQELRAAMQQQFVLGWKIFSVNSWASIDANNQPVVRFAHILVRDEISNLIPPAELKTVEEADD